MATIGLRLKEKNNEALIAFAREIVLHIAGNPAVLDTKPRIDELIDSVNALESACVAQVSTSRKGNKLIRLRRTVLELQLSNLAIQIENLANGDAAIISGTGMPLRKRSRSTHIKPYTNQ